MKHVTRKLMIPLVMLCCLLLTGCADKSALQALLETSVQAEDCYTPNSFAVYAAALELASEVNEVTFAKQEEVDAAAAELQAGIDGLLLRADKTELEALKAAAGEIDQALYIPVTVATLEEVLKDADAVIENLNALEHEVVLTAAELETAMDKLVLKPDKTKLASLYDDSAATDTSLYLSGSATKFTYALTRAKTVLDDENATEEDVAGATEGLNEAIKALELKPDKAPLENLLAKAGEYEEMKYTTATYDKLTAEISAARSTVNDSEATQKEVDEAVADLQSAISSLKKCTKYVWRVRPYLYLEDDNHVGHDWSDAIYYNGKEVWGSFEVTKAIGSTIQITGKAVENDSIPDSGSGTLTLKLTDGNSASKTFYVRENRGRYSGYQAVWELSAECEIIGRE